MATAETNQTVPLFLSRLRDPLRKCFAANSYTVTGEVTKVNPYQDSLYVTLAGEENSRPQWITVYIRGEIVDRCGVIPEEGMNLQVTGTIGLMRNEIQLYVQQMEEVGLGKMQEQIREWERKYQHLINREKRSLPVLCKRVAVISSTTAQGYEDFISHLTNGTPTLFDCRMQGEYAAPSIAEAIRKINRSGGYDCICIVRGGGSFTDLYPYNMPQLLDAIAGSAIPVAVAVGHESDSSLCDQVADASFATPTALALTLSGQKDRYLESRKQQLRERTFQENSNRRMIVAGVIILSLLGTIAYLIMK